MLVITVDSPHVFFQSILYCPRRRFRGLQKRSDTILQTGIISKYHDMTTKYCFLIAVVLYFIVFFCKFREGDAMAVSYNRLWKLLIDKGMTKTEMRKAAGISTNVLAKMGRDETVSMDTLARIAAVMKCGLNDIVEISAEKES